MGVAAAFLQIHFGALNQKLHAKACGRCIAVACADPTLCASATSAVLPVVLVDDCGHCEEEDILLSWLAFRSGRFGKPQGGRQHGVPSSVAAGVYGYNGLPVGVPAQYTTHACMLAQSRLHHDRASLPSQPGLTDAMFVPPRYACCALHFIICTLTHPKYQGTSHSGWRIPQGGDRTCPGVSPCGLVLRPLRPLCNGWHTAGCSAG